MARMVNLYKGSWFQSSKSFALWVKWGESQVLWNVYLYLGIIKKAPKFVQNDRNDWLTEWALWFQNASTLNVCEHNEAKAGCYKEVHLCLLIDITKFHKTSVLQAYWLISRF